MGSRSSRRAQRMEEDHETGEAVGGSGNGESAGGQGGGTAEGEGEMGRDLATILSYLIRSGQVRILASHGLYDEDEDHYDEEDEDFVGPANPPSADPNPDTSNIQLSAFKEEVMLESGMFNPSACKSSISQMITKREIGMRGRQQFSKGECCVVGCNYLPNNMEVKARYHHKAFCGIYSQSGDVFLSACQDQNVRIYNTSKGQFDKFRSIRARDVGWSVLDVAFSPDGNYLIYSSWSDSVHLCNIYGDYDTHQALRFSPNVGRFACFSMEFSRDNSEILGGANDGHLYVYDREQNTRTLRIDAHEDDVNAVAFADDGSQILFSGGDDGLVKVWDRRMLTDENPYPVGVLAGHMDGITFIDSKGDSRYLLSNCKDQTIKLWDMRKFSTQDAQEQTRREVSKQNWDYRWQQVPRRVAISKKKLAGDCSLMTYRGHSVLHTLVRARFSPIHTTGQKYIYSGCATGAVVIYDALTGQIVKSLDGHRACVRDVSWHPYEHIIMSTSWDGSIGEWRYRYTDIDSDEDMSSSDEEDTEETRNPRRSTRLKQQRRQLPSRRSRPTVILD